MNKPPGLRVRTNFDVNPQFAYSHELFQKEMFVSLTGMHKSMGELLYILPIPEWLLKMMINFYVACKKLTKKKNPYSNA